jgi:glucose-1-phosphate cytidylyltransferase
MKAVILAGGMGTRLSEETQFKPKPLVEAGGKPLIWHIMQNFFRFGVSEFIILSGYKGHLMKEYFANFWLHQADITFDLTNPNREIHNLNGLPWKVTILDTGLNTTTGGRISYLKNLLSDNFFLTYGDGVADVDLQKLLLKHKETSNVATLTAVQPLARFGSIDIRDGQVTSFREKSNSEESWVNGGFFVLTPNIFDYIEDANLSFESDVLPKVARDNKLGVYKHSGFWQPVDTLRDLKILEKIIDTKGLPWI